MSATRKDIQKKMNSISRQINKLAEMVVDCDDLPKGAGLYFEAGGNLHVVEADYAGYRGDIVVLMVCPITCNYDCGGL